MKNRYLYLTISCLLIFIVGMQIYVINEPGRMAAAEKEARSVYVAEGVITYIDYCADCHGNEGEGQGLMPALNNPALAEADSAILFQVIARAAHGTAMAAWHIEEGGSLDDYQIGSLVALIKENNWELVTKVTGKNPPEAKNYYEMQNSILYYSSPDNAGPHDCMACHEEPALHADQFGLECANCHTLVAWKPAFLTRHIFEINHGAEGNQPCQNCHTDSYIEYTCFQCHDHQPDDMQEAHVKEGLLEYDRCIDCHPTGAPDEAEEITARQ